MSVANVKRAIASSRRQNSQNADGSVTISDVLRPCMGGTEKLSK